MQGFTIISYFLTNCAKLLIHVSDNPLFDIRSGRSESLHIFYHFWVGAPNSVNVVVTQYARNRFIFTADAVIQGDLQ